MKVRLLMKVKMMKMKAFFSGDLRPKRPKRPKRSSALLGGPKNLVRDFILTVFFKSCLRDFIYCA